LSKHFVDSNVFYYHFLQDEVQGPISTEIIQRIKRGESATTSVIVISELISLFEFRILQSKKRKDISSVEREYIIEQFDKSVINFQKLLDNLVHLEKVSCTFEDARRAFLLMPQYNLGYNDCVNLSIIEREKIKNIYSFDKDFDRVPWLSRKNS
jgi:predicted nucleic acid-binding protein